MRSCWTSIRSSRKAGGWYMACTWVLGGRDRIHKNAAGDVVPMPFAGLLRGQPGAAGRSIFRLSCTARVVSSCQPWIVAHIELLTPIDLSAREPMSALHDLGFEAV